MRSPLRWYGGKHYMIKHLLKLMPRHDRYIEVFGGGANLLFAKERCNYEVYNDIYGDLVNFFRVLRDRDLFIRFLDQINFILYSREEFDYAKNMITFELDPLKRAVYFFVLNRFSFSGNNKTFAISLKDNQRVKCWINMIDELPLMHDRFRGVLVERRDFRKIFEVFDSKDTFFYLDPPYISDTRKSKNDYKHEMSDADHTDLIDLCLASDSMIMLSGYKHNLYKRLVEAGWDYKEIVMKCYASNANINKTRDMRIEGIWRNQACMERVNFLQEECMFAGDESKILEIGDVG